MYSLIRPILFSIDAEKAHNITLSVIKHLQKSRVFLSIIRPKNNPRLQTNIFSQSFTSPIGLAAGLDKNGEAISFWEALGFGFAEIGTITSSQQNGHSWRRIERLIKDSSIINRMGCPNKGVFCIYQDLQKIKKSPSFIVGANIGKNSTTKLDESLEDYMHCFRTLRFLVDYFTINISSPNTKDLRLLQNKELLEPLLDKLQDENNWWSKLHNIKPKPFLIKISPDLSYEEIDQIVELAIKYKIDGIVATNTSINKNILSSTPKIDGGISGKPIADRSYYITKHLYKQTKGQLKIVSVGGIDSPEEAYKRICTGASLIQIYTGLVYKGPGLIKKINKGLLKLLDRDGLTSIEQAVGIHHA